jgi:hypothetical protein
VLFRSWEDFIPDELWDEFTDMMDNFDDVLKADIVFIKYGKSMTEIYIALIPGAYYDKNYK